LEIQSACDCSQVKQLKDNTSLSSLAAACDIGVSGHETLYNNRSGKEYAQTTAVSGDDSEMKMRIKT
jgi:hypothetical protein